MKQFLIKKAVQFLFLCFLAVILFISGTGCANIVPPGGGPRDSTAPRLVIALPKDSALRVATQKITLTFDEFIELKNANENILVMPYPAKQPYYESKLRSLSIKLKDSLLPNTTYVIDFGNAISDINEGNVLKNFRYVFSTGTAIDTNELKGTVLLAETGKADSTMFALLYTKAEDSTVFKEVPKYVARINSKGNFRFTNLPPGIFYVYALLDADGNKKYNQPIEQFAFLDNPVTINGTVAAVQLYAYASEKEKSKTTKPPDSPKGTVKQLSFTTNLQNGTQELDDSLKLFYPKPLQNIQKEKIRLVTDSATVVNNVVITNDTINQKLVVHSKWQMGKSYTLFLDSSYATDTSGLSTTKNDTISFRVKDEKEFGSVRIRWKELDTSRHPVLLLLNNDQLAGSYPISGKEWYRKLFNPGTYQLAVLYDTNQNGKWDPGDYFSKPRRQPEIVVRLNKEITIKGNWDNETEVDFINQ